MGNHDLTAIIYDKRGRVLSIGKNSYIKTHPQQALFATRVGQSEKIYLHAEMAAIIKLNYSDMQRAHKIFIARYGKDGRPLMAKPCKICQSAIKAANIKNVLYTVETTQ